MKIVMEFTMPEEEQAMVIAVNAQHLHSALVESDRILRAVTKHGDDPEKAIEAARSEIAEALGRVEP